MALRLSTFSKADSENVARCEQPTDYQVIDEIRAGNIDCYEVIMRRYNQRLYRIARSILLDEQRSMDAVQNAHIKAFEKLASFNGNSGFSTWICVIARNEALMIRRKSQPEWLALADSDNSQAQPSQHINQQSSKPPSRPEELMENRQLRALLNRHIDNLPEKFRTVFIMRCVEELSVRETAEILDLNPATVKTRVFRAKSLLQESITRQHRAAAYEFGGHHCDVIVARVLAYLRAMST